MGSCLSTQQATDLVAQFGSIGIELNRIKTAVIGRAVSKPTKAVFISI